MKTLYICRHAKTNNYSADGLDHSRALTSGGIQNALDLGKLLGKRLSQTNKSIELIVSSDAQRAMHTAQLIKSVLPITTTLELSSQLYAAVPDDIINYIQQLSQASIMIVAHNPCLEELAWMLTGQTQHLRPCHCLCLELEMDSWLELSKKPTFASKILLSSLLDD